SGVHTNHIVWERLHDGCLASVLARQQSSHTGLLWRDCRIHLYVQCNGQSTHKGHEDWIRGVEWVYVEGDLLLASCAQDCLIRVWRLVAKSGTEGNTQDEHTIRMTEDVFKLTDTDASSVFAVTLESVLAGHENKVYGVHWQTLVIKGTVLSTHTPFSPQIRLF
uniref:Elongator complex protein 2 n=1 Tax=Hucho hucho TaxID=62062 RepID=A0A4W5PHV6_9TELE